MGFKEKLGAAFELPSELTSDVAKITVVGRNEISIENYKGIIEYSDKEVKIGCGNYQIHISGTRLELKTATGEVLYISGLLDKIEWLY